MRYNSMMDMAFTVEHDCEDPDKIPVMDVINACQARLDEIRRSVTDKGWDLDAFGHSDTYEIEDGQKLPGDTGGVELPRS